MSQSIHVENLGPIKELSFALQSYGITVLRAPNSSGKSILLEAVQAAAKGSGKLPLMDRAKRGKVEAFGATITIGGTCRHTGDFEVTNLEGRFDLAKLVDPGLKTQAAADAARIKALVALTGVAANPELFKAHEAFENFDSIVSQTAIIQDDLVEMARIIKADYDTAARKAESTAEREEGFASGLQASDGIDLNAPHNQTALNAAYDTARDYRKDLTARAERCRAVKEKRDAARNQIAELSAKIDSDKVSELVARQNDTQQLLAVNADKLAQVDRNIADLEEAMNTALKERAARVLQREKLQQDMKLCESELQGIQSTKEAIAKFEAYLSGDCEASPTEQQLQEAQEAVVAASAAMEQGAVIRQALVEQEQAESHRKLAAEQREMAARLRDAGKATDEVLSASISNEYLRVESDGKSAVVVTDTERGKAIPYHDLSDGEKWKIAIDIGADQVGENGLLVVSQVGFEGLDGANRLAIHDHAVSRKVYILTAEASSDPDVEKVIVPVPFESAAV